MSLDPRQRAAWKGFLDLMRPPVGYRIDAVIGTTFGLSFDALIAALMAMLDADAEEQAADPVASVIAITHLAPKVRILLHPGTIEGVPEGLSKRLVGMLDRVIAQVPVTGGLFHPKVWLLRFRRIEQGGTGHEPPEMISRLIVGSRNLTRSSSFELGVAIEGAPSGEPSPLSGDLASALTRWIGTAATSARRLGDMAEFARKQRFDVPREGEESARLRFQGLGVAGLHTHVPARLGRAVLVAPFLRPELIRMLLDRSDELRIVSNGDAFEQLDDPLFDALEQRKQAQGSPVLYAVGEHGDPEDAHIDGLHAKLLLADDGKRSVTFVGSANGTGPGWGLAGSNVEAMMELRPGLRHDVFVRSFLLDEKKRFHPWVREFEREDRAPEDETEKIERRLLGLLRRVAARDFEVHYEIDIRRLTVRVVSRAADTAGRPDGADDVEVAPLCRAQSDESWRRLAQLRGADLVAENVDFADVTAFVVLRAREGAVTQTRIALAKLCLSDVDLERRDEAARIDVLATARPEDVLRALVFGLGRLPVVGSPNHGGGGGRRTTSPQRLLDSVTIESLLQAVAANPDLIREMRLLLGRVGGDFQRFCTDVEHALETLRQESTA